MSHVPNGVTLAVAALALTVGCNKSNQSAASDSANGAVSSAMAPDSSSMSSPDSTTLVPIDSTALAAPKVSAAIPGTMPADAGGMSSSPSSSDAGILSTAADGDSAEVLVARFAEPMATNPSVKAYARMLVTDHERGLHAIDSTASTLSFGAPMVSSQVAGTSGVMAQLRAMPKGLAFDTAFVNQMVTGHQAAIALTRQNESSAQKPEVKAALRKEIATMQRHLDRGKALQAELAKKS